jgi:hypothetical protein
MMQFSAQEAASTATAAPSLTRPPAVAGRFYPGEPQILARTVQKLLDTAPIADLGGVRGLIVPHAGYVCSGPVAAASFNALRALPKAEYTVYLLGPAHWQPVFGVGLANADAFETPLGLLSVARNRVHELLRRGPPYRLANAAHAPEHCLEVELPFLQVTLGNPRIVPMLFDADAEPQRIGADLAEILAADPLALIVVSSDLSHYLPYHEAYAVDRALLTAVTAGDIEQVQSGQACGLIPILVLMTIAKEFHWQPHLLAYANSGDACGPRREVVGYGAVAYTTGD